MNTKNSKTSPLSLRSILDLYDNPMGALQINNNELEPIYNGTVYDIIDLRSTLLNEKVVAFGYYDDTLCVRINV